MRGWLGRLRRGLTAVPLAVPAATAPALVVQVSVPRNWHTVAGIELDLDVSDSERTRSRRIGLASGIELCYLRTETDRQGCVGELTIVHTLLEVRTGVHAGRIVDTVSMNLEYNASPIFPPQLEATGAGTLG